MNISKEVKKKIYILGIETSCDETSASIVEAEVELQESSRSDASIVEAEVELQESSRSDASIVEAEVELRKSSRSDASIVEAEVELQKSSRYAEPAKLKILSNIIHSQIEIHRKFGGVVPEIASRNHTMAITTAVDSALMSAGLALSDIDAIGVTYGAGLLGALLVGVSYAKALSFALDKPLIKVNHIEAHIAANFLNIAPPFICLVVSGGHTMIVKVSDYYKYEILTQTVDDAAGEAFDKVARTLKLPYPGGPEIDRLSKGGNPSINFFKHSKGIVCEGGFSYSGLKTAVINYLHNAEQKKEKVDIADVCASFQKEAIMPLIESALAAAKKHGINTVAVAGGVSANSYLRENMRLEGKKCGIEVGFPDIELCTDNAAMVAVRTCYDFVAGRNIADYDLNAVSAILEKTSAGSGK